MLLDLCELSRGSCRLSLNLVVVFQVISEALLSLSAEESDETFATVYMPIVVEGHKR